MEKAFFSSYNATKRSAGEKRSKGQVFSVINASPEMVALKIQRIIGIRSVLFVNIVYFSTKQRIYQ